MKMENVAFCKVVFLDMAEHDRNSYWEIIGDLGSEAIGI